ncbi:MAG: hypothetical protein K2H14_03635, partial [Muribaculaceae bacterium]|nr:hypothetical protein [Muribaculaceae bacterium]
MNKAIIRYRNAIIALIMIAVNGVGASASAPWTVNPGDFRYDMSLYLDMAFAVSDMDYTLYDVGVFSGDECRGIAERLPLGNGSECLYLRARSNQENGETMTFRYRDKETGEELPVDGVSFTFESDGRLGYPSDPYNVKIIRHYDVVFSAGEGGSVDNEGGRLAEGTEITLTATPDEGYHFNGWSDGVTENPRQIIVDGDIALSAQFAVNSYSLTYVVDGETYRQLTVDFGTEIVPEET